MVIGNLLKHEVAWKGCNGIAPQREFNIGAWNWSFLDRCGWQLLLCAVAERLHRSYSHQRTAIVDWSDVSDRGFAHSRLHLYDSYRPHPHSHADRRRCRVLGKFVHPVENSFVAVPAIIAVENSTSDRQTASI